jgi:3',5'-cyclic AMP phosphodiesterase CpdA
VIAVSGDLTQRARNVQFASARAFLDTLTAPLVVVPGNHDVPLYDVIRRFARPLKRFHRYVGGYARYIDDELAVVGADTTRSFTIKDGGLTRLAVDTILAEFAEVAPAATRMLVCHHPFDRVPRGATRWAFPAVWTDAVSTLVEHGVDIILTGHRHLSYAGHSATRYRTSGRAAVIVEAGTATSVRGRGEANAFNVLHVDREAINVERQEWQPQEDRFVAAQEDRFTRTQEGWAPARATRG